MYKNWGYRKKQKIHIFLTYIREESTTHLIHSIIHLQFDWGWCINQKLRKVGVKGFLYTLDVFVVLLHPDLHLLQDL